MFPSAKSRNGFVTIPIIPVVSKATVFHAYPNLTSKTGNVCPVFSQWLLSFDQQCSSDGVRVSSTHQTPWKKKIVLRESKPGFIPQERLEGAFWTCDMAYKNVQLSFGLSCLKRTSFCLKRLNKVRLSACQPVRFIPLLSTFLKRSNASKTHSLFIPSHFFSFSSGHHG